MRRLSEGMVRTQIRLSPEEHEAARKAAERLGISLAEFVRRAVRQALPVSPEKPWMTYCGSVESGDSDSSGRIDDIVYGRKE